MLKPIRISEEHHKIFFWSDTHWGHDRNFIFQDRGFKSIQDHDEALISCWNKIVPHDGTIFHLGDMMAKSNELKFWELVRRLNFSRLFALLGNHTSGQKQAFQSAVADVLGREDTGLEIYPLDIEIDGNPNRILTFLPEYVEVHAKKTLLTLCHYPISSWHKMSSESICLHGHCHSNLREKLPFRFDVGVENFPAGPVSLVEILRLTRGMTPAKVDHH